jgi:hypothetical protein
VHLLNVILLIPVDMIEIMKKKDRSRAGQTNLATIIALYVIVLGIEIDEEIDIKAQKTLSVEILHRTQVEKRIAVIPIREMEIARAEGNMKSGRLKIMIIRKEEKEKMIMRVTIAIEALNVKMKEIDLPTIVSVLKMGMIVGVLTVEMIVREIEVTTSKRKDLWAKKSDQKIGWQVWRKLIVQEWHSFGKEIDPLNIRTLRKENKF